MELQGLSSNWKKLQSTLNAENSHTKASSASQNTLKRKRPISNTSTQKAAYKRSGQTPTTNTKSKRQKMDTQIEQTLKVESTINAGLSPNVEIGKYIALDCEMVGVGPTLPSGTESALARASIVNYNGEQIYDSYVLPKEPVTDWRTHVSGIKPSHMKQARTFEEAQKDVAEILKDRVVVGHALRHDFKALLLDHPLKDIRDTSRFAPYRKLAGGTPKLSLLASQLLGLEIQSGEHSSLEDARACMLLFRRDKDAFETRKPKQGRKR